MNMMLYFKYNFGASGNVRYDRSLLSHALENKTFKIEKICM